MKHFAVSRYENIATNQTVLTNLPVTPWCKVFLNTQMADQEIPCCYGSLLSSQELTTGPYAESFAPSLYFHVSFL
jgi:hypothetical protein